MSFKGKSVLVTGGSSGIGAATAKHFAAEGAKVAIVGRNVEKLKIVEEEIAKVGTKPIVIVADMTKDEDVKRIIDETIKSFGSLDVLVNNAGMAKRTLILDADLMSNYDKVISTNFRSVVYLTHLTVPYLISSKGNIVNVSSVAATKVLPESFVYCSSKAALDMFTKCLASELGPKGVRVNSVNPGPVVTDIAQNAGVSKEQAYESYQYFKQNTSLERVSEPEEIANVVLFLANNTISKGITGSLFTSDNGFLVK